MYLIFDTETTGKAEFKLPPEHEAQPRMVQLAALLLDKDFNQRASFVFIIKPEGFEILPALAAIHGITTEIATQYGVAEKAALQAFAGLCRRATTLIAHNITFDAIVIGKASFIQKMDFAPPVNKFCTMEAMTNICKLPGKYGKFKWPTLTEAYQHCTGQLPVKAHDAMADVESCATIYQWLHKQNLCVH